MVRWSAGWKECREQGLSTESIGAIGDAGTQRVVVQTQYDKYKSVMSPESVDGGRVVSVVVVL